MTEHVHITLPVYYTQHLKTKPDLTFLVGMNIKKQIKESNA